MNRADRRKQEKQQPKVLSRKKLYAWVKSLSKEQQELMTQYANDISDRNFDKVTTALDTSFTAAMIQKTEMQFDEITDVFANAYELMKDDRLKDKAGKEQFKTEGEYLEFMKKIEESIKQDVTDLLSIGQTEKEIREELFLKYPTISKSKITNAVKKTKEIIEVDKETSIAAEKILNIIEGNGGTEVAVKKESKAEVKVVVEPIKAVKKDKPLEGLKIKKMEITGRFAHYISEGKRVKFELNRGFDLKSWNEFKAEVEEVFELVGK